MIFSLATLEPFTFFMLDNVFIKSRENFARKYKKDIINAELRVRNDPYTAGPEYRGKSNKGIHHFIMRDGIRLIYCICADSRKFNNTGYRLAKSRKDTNFHPCKICTDACINFPANSIMLLKYLTHDEQANLFGGL